jgi:hypothetical protein
MLPSRALSLKNPWLWYVLNRTHPSPKGLENRKRRIMNWREWSPIGEFWLHASQSEGEAYWKEAIEKVRARFGADYPIPRFAECQRGGIVGRARVVAMVTPAGELQPEGGDAAALHDVVGAIDMRWHEPGEHAYVLADVRPVPFAKCNGALGFWRVDPKVLAHLAAMGER